MDPRLLWFHVCLMMDNTNETLPYNTIVRVKTDKMILMSDNTVQTDGRYCFLGDFFFYLCLFFFFNPIVYWCYFTLLLELSGSSTYGVALSLSVKVIFG